LRAYTRVSTTEQREKGVSLDAQRRRLKGYCDAHGLALLRIEEDAGISAKTVRRPGLHTRTHTTMNSPPSEQMPSHRESLLVGSSMGAIDSPVRSGRFGS